MGIVPSIDITAGQRKTILALLERHLPDTEAWAYGSRAKQTSRPQSDLDMVVFATPGQEHGVSNLREAFEDSNLPFRVDLFDWNDVPNSFRNQIKRDHVILTKPEVCVRNWRRMSFTEAVSVNPAVRLQRGMTYPFVDMAAVMIGTRCVHAGEQRIYSGSGSRFQDGDTLMARITPCLENGKIARYCTSPPSANAHGSTEFIVIRGRSGVTDSEYAYYLTKWQEVRNYAVDQMTGTSGRQRVPVDSLGNLMVPVPPLPEQRAIAHILSALDDKIELNRRMNETLEAMARAIFRDWFVDFGPTRAKEEGGDPYLPPEIWGLFPDTLDDNGIPEGWVILTVGDFLELAYGKSLPAKRRIPGRFPVYGSGGVLGTHDTALIEGPAIIVGRKGTVGSLYWENESVFPIDTVFYVVPRIGSSLFCYHLLATQPLQDMNTDAAVPGLNRENVYRLKFPQPCLRLVSAFEDAIHTSWCRRTRNLTEAKTLSRIRDLLLPKLISGNIRLATAERAAENVA